MPCPPITKYLKGTATTNYETMSEIRLWANVHTGTLIPLSHHFILGLSGGTVPLFFDRNSTQQNGST